MSKQRIQLEAVRRELERIAKWPEPERGAGREVGALYGAGMYAQYAIDRQRHESEIAAILKMVRE